VASSWAVAGYEPPRETEANTRWACRAGRSLSGNG
jgi:hypothetical protein